MFFIIIFGYKFNDRSESEKNILTANRGGTQVLFVDWCEVSTTQFIYRSHWILISRSDNYFGKDWVFCQYQSICVMTTDNFWRKILRDMGYVFLNFWFDSFLSSFLSFRFRLRYLLFYLLLWCFLKIIVILHMYSRTEMCPYVCLVRLWYLWLEGLSDGTRLDRTLSSTWNDWFRWGR